MSNDIPTVDADMPGMNTNAVSVFGQNDSVEDFPVLKAFQQYIDAEQAKSRKRILMLCAFFAVLMAIVIALFSAMLLNMNARNQTLNDRLVDFAMKERSSGPVVVQPAAQPVVQQDNSALMALTTKLSELQRQIDAAKSEPTETKPTVTSPIVPAIPTGPSAEHLEIERLKAQLAREKKQAAIEKEKQHQIELELYRRKNYPELYEKKPAKKKPVKTLKDQEAEADAAIKDAISYFSDPNEEAEPLDDSEVKKSDTDDAEDDATDEDEDEADEADEDVAAPAETNRPTPVKVRKSSGGYHIPVE